MTLFLIMFTFSVFLLYLVGVVIEKINIKTTLKQKKELEKQKEKMFDSHRVTRVFKGIRKKETEEKVERFLERIKRQNTLFSYSDNIQVKEMYKEKKHYVVEVTLEKHILKRKYNKKNLFKLIEENKELDMMIKNL